MKKKGGKPTGNRGKVVEIVLKKAIVFNDCVITKARIEIDHIDGNHKNDKPSNLAALHLHCHDQRHARRDA